jgi:MFS family permease
MRSSAATRTAACLAMGAIAMSITASGVALTSVQRDLGVGITELQWVLNGFILSFAALLLPFGSLGDRLGQRPLFLTGTVVFALATLMSALAPSFVVLMMGRALMGCGAALLAATGPPALTAAFSDDADRKRAFGYLGASGGIGLTLGALLAGVIASWSGWRGAFAIHLPVVVTALFVALHGFESRTGRVGRTDVSTCSGSAGRPGSTDHAGAAEHSIFSDHVGVAGRSGVADDLGVVGRADARLAQFDWGGMVLCALAIGLLMTFGITGPEHGWTSVRVLTTLAMALLTGTAFAVVESRHASPLVNLATFRNRQFLVACAVCLLFTTVWVALFIYVPLNLQTLQSRSSVDAGVTMLGLMVPAPIMPMIVSRLILRVPIASVLTSGFLFMAVGAGVLFTAWSGHMPRTLELAGLVACGIGAGALYGLVDYLAMTALPDHQTGVASGVFNLVRLMGDALGAIVPGSILLQALRTAFEPYNSIDVPRATLNEIAAGQFAAADRLASDATSADALHRLATSAFGAGMGYALVALCAIAAFGAALTWTQSRTRSAGLMLCPVDHSDLP